MKKIANICGARIKLRRETLGLTQVDVAAALEVDSNVSLDRSDISEIERGVRSVKDFELVALAEALNTTTTYLLFGVDD